MAGLVPANPAFFPANAQPAPRQTGPLPLRLAQRTEKSNKAWMAGTSPRASGTGCAFKPRSPKQGDCAYRDDIVRFELRTGRSRISSVFRPVAMVFGEGLRSAAGA